jgi:hypothetical protein
MASVYGRASVADAASQHAKTPAEGPVYSPAHCRCLLRMHMVQLRWTTSAWPPPSHREAVPPSVVARIEKPFSIFWPMVLWGRYRELLVGALIACHETQSSPCRRPAPRSRMDPAFAAKSGSRGKSPLRCRHGRIASAASQRQTVVPPTVATPPRVTRRAATPATRLQPRCAAAASGAAGQRHSRRLTCLRR